MTTLDPITIEVIGAAMASIVEETGETLIRASLFHQHQGAPRLLDGAVRRRRRDAVPGRAHPDPSRQLPRPHRAHHAALPDPEIRPGDAFIGNDAYEGGGTHLPDIVLAEPIFIDGRLVAWTVNLAHHADFVDRGHAHIFQEGLRIPPVRLYRAGELQDDVQDLILLNCQVPGERLSDLRAQMAANRVGVQRFQALAAKYGTATVLQAGEALMDYAERKMRAAIAAMPDGTWRFEDVFDNEEVAGPAAARRRGHGEGRCHVACLRRAGTDARRHQHDLHGAARHDLLHREVGAGSRHSAQCRPGAAAQHRGAPRAAS